MHTKKEIFWSEEDQAWTHYKFVRCGISRCGEFAFRRLIWPSGDDVYLCVHHMDALWIADYMMVQNLGDPDPTDTGNVT